MTPTARSLAHLRAAGWHVARVEQRLPIPGRSITRDAFNFGDLLGANAALPDGQPTLFQVTSGDNLSSRIRKAKDHAGPLLAWLLKGGRLVVHGWRKLKPRGERERWALREVELHIEDLIRESSSPAEAILTGYPEPLGLLIHPQNEKETDHA